MSAWYMCLLCVRMPRPRLQDTRPHTAGVENTLPCDVLIIVVRRDGGPGRKARGFDEHKRAGLLAPESSSGPALPCANRAQWRCGAVVVRYSGATVRDLHPIPYSPQAVARGTRL